MVGIESLQIVGVAGRRDGGSVRFVVPRFGLMALALGTGGCLEPVDEGQRPLRGAFPAETMSPDEAPFVDFDRPGFVTRVDALVGFTEGSTVAFWRMDGRVTDLIVPVFRLVRAGRPLVEAAAILDVLPGDRGYGPFWRIHTVEVTDAYEGQKIWSRAAVQAGVELGLLETPVPTETVLVAPLSRDATTIEGAPPRVVDLWYRNQRAPWVIFPERLTVPLEVRRVEADRSFLFQRLTQAFVLDELEEGLDLNGDGVLTYVHEVLPSGPKALCDRVLARTSSSARSIDGLGPVDVRSADDPALEGVGAPPVVGLRPLGEQVLCPKAPR